MSYEKTTDPFENIRSVPEIPSAPEKRKPGRPPKVPQVTTAIAPQVATHFEGPILNPTPSPVVEDPFIKPEAWMIKRAFSHEGIRRSPGNKVPKMLRSVAAILEREGNIVPLDPDGTVTGGSEARPNLAKPKNAEDYLRGHDRIVLLKLRTFRPDEKIIRQVYRAAVRFRRSTLLREALLLKLNVPAGGESDA